jgi:hypothetical protein
LVAEKNVGEKGASFFTGKSFQNMIFFFFSLDFLGDQNNQLDRCLRDEM